MGQTYRHRRPSDNADGQRKTSRRREAQTPRNSQQRQAKTTANRREGLPRCEGSALWKPAPSGSERTLASEEVARRLARFEVSAFWKSAPVGSQSPVSSEAVIRRRARDRHVVRMRFTKTRRGDTDENRFGPKFVDVGAADITHPAPQAADHLVQHVADRALVGHTPLDAFGDEILRRQLAFL